MRNTLKYVVLFIAQSYKRIVKNTLKKNTRFYLNVYLDATDVYAGLNNYIKFYNDERRHQSLNYLFTSPH